MKKLITIAATRFILVLSFLSGFNAEALVANPSTHAPAKSVNEIGVTPPVTPKEADFNDVIPQKAPVMVSLSPTFPKEATFEDEETTPDLNENLIRVLAPEFPKEADFDNPDNISADGLSSLKPVTPKEATFVDF